MRAHAGIRGHRRPPAGARHRHQCRHLRRRSKRAPRTAPLRVARTTDRRLVGGQGHAGGVPGFVAGVGTELPRLAARKPFVQPPGGDEAGAARTDRVGPGGAPGRNADDAWIIRDAACAAVTRAHVPRRRGAPGSNGCGDHQRCVLADPPCGRSARPRANADPRRRAANGGGRHASRLPAPIPVVDRQADRCLDTDSAHRPADRPGPEQLGRPRAPQAGGHAFGSAGRNGRARAPPHPPLPRGRPGVGTAAGTASLRPGWPAVRKALAAARRFDDGAAGGLPQRRRTLRGA